MTINKTISHDISVFIKVLTRSFFGLIFLVPLILHTGIKKTLKTEHFSIHLLRALFGFSSIACTYYAYTHLNMSLATTIGFIQPMIVAFIAIIFLKEKFSLDRWIAMISAYIGVIIAVKPFGHGFDPSVLVAFMANIFSSSAIILSKKLTKTDNNATILFYFTVIIMLISGVISIFNWTPISTLDKIRLFFMAGATTFSHYSYVQALRLGKVTLVAPFEYSRLVFAIPVGVFFFSEQIYLSTIFAAIIIIASNLYVMHRARIR